MKFSFSGVAWYWLEYAQTSYQQPTVAAELQTLWYSLEWTWLLELVYTNEILDLWNLR